MSFKKRIILSKFIAFLLSLIFFGLGIFKNSQELINIGIAMFVCVLFLFIKQWKVLSSPEKLKELENSYNDERTVFIARKSYSFALWLSIYAEFIGIIITMYIGNNEISTILSMIVCLQVLAYSLSNIFYSKKY